VYRVSNSIQRKIYTKREVIGYNRTNDIIRIILKMKLYKDIRRQQYPASGSKV
jgi:hypothetical protein